MKRIHEIDSLLCPFSGAEMRITAFITEHRLPRFPAHPDALDELKEDRAKTQVLRISEFGLVQLQRPPLQRKLDGFAAASGTVAKAITVPAAKAT